MSVTPDTLSASASRGLDVIVKDVAALVDKAILDAPRQCGPNVATCELPTEFPTSTLRKADAQRVVYSSIIRSLQARKFTNVRIYLGKDDNKAVLVVGWVSELDQKDIAAMDRVISGARITKEELERLTSGATTYGAAAPKAGARPKA